MPEQSERALPKQEICTIRIMFPVKSDEHAIVYKKKIAEILSDNPETLMDFNIKTMPRTPNVDSIRTTG